MRKRLIFGLVGATAVAGAGIGAVTANTSGLDTWMSGKNHNRIIEVQNEGGVQADSGKTGIAFFSNSAFRITSPRGISIMVDPWRNDPSGAWDCGTEWSSPTRKSISACRPMRTSITTPSAAGGQHAAGPYGRYLPVG